MSILDRIVERARSYLGAASPRAGDGATAPPGLPLDPVLEEQLNRLRHAVCDRPPREPGSVLVTSAVEGEGKTTVALGLARAIARSLDHAAILVETDLRRPRLADLLGIDPGPGVLGHILRGVPVERTVRESGIPKLAVVCAGGRSDAAAYIVSSAAMQRLVAGLRERAPGRMIVFDAPPVLAAPETLAIARLACAIVLAVRAEVTPRDLVRKAFASLPREKIAGVVLNATPLRRRDRRLLYSYYRQCAGGARGDGGAGRPAPGSGAA